MSDNVLIAILAALPATIASVGALIVTIRTSGKVEAVHIATNSMKDALVAAALIEGHGKGVADERAARTAKEDAHAASFSQGQAQEKKDEAK